MARIKHSSRKKLSICGNIFSVIKQRRNPRHNYRCSKYFVFRVIRQWKKCSLSQCFPIHLHKGRILLKYRSLDALRLLSYSVSLNNKLLWHHLNIDWLLLVLPYLFGELTVRPQAESWAYFGAKEFFKSMGKSLSLNVIPFLFLPCLICLDCKVFSTTNVVLCVCRTLAGIWRSCQCKEMEVKGITRLRKCVGK